jgi:hypothetical protein
LPRHHNLGKYVHGVAKKLKQIKAKVGVFAR